MLTPKEKEELVKMFDSVISIQNATINGHFEAIKVELSYIKDKGDKTYEQATRTNGRVNKHDVDIDRIVNDGKNWKQRLAYNVVVLFIAGISVYVTLNTVSSMFDADLNKAKTEVIKESIKDDKEQNVNIENNRKAINIQAIDNAFEKSKAENKQ